MAQLDLFDFFGDEMGANDVEVPKSADVAAKEAKKAEKEAKKTEKKTTSSTTKSSSKKKEEKDAKDCIINYPVTFKTEGLSIEVPDYKGTNTSTLQQLAELLVEEHDVYQLKVGAARLIYKAEQVTLIFNEDTEDKAAVTDFPVMICYGRETREISEDEHMYNLGEIRRDFIYSLDMKKCTSVYDPTTGVIVCFHDSKNIITPKPDATTEVKVGSDIVTIEGNDVKSLGYNVSVSLVEDNDGNMCYPVLSADTKDTVYVVDISKFVTNEGATISTDRIFLLPATIMYPSFDRSADIRLTPEEVGGKDKVTISELAKILSTKETFNEMSEKDYKERCEFHQIKGSDKIEVLKTKSSKLG